MGSPVLTVTGGSSQEENFYLKMKSRYYARYTFVFHCVLPGMIQSEELRNSSGRVISLFSVIRFPNIECQDSDGTKGECYTATECSGRGGTYTTSCANGLGVCCYIVQESDGMVTDVTLNNTYIRNSGYAGGYLHPGHSLTR
eukprot:TRINITY_DN21845_c0_g1_i1.p1 TRINITY_DN21845_c0_g1~~TRINITY_DN21845_c0_g1_i1.p1  ORF type:complete len:150 (-),score=31.96 TRINITY_DN21845_c0_g1_i1:39-464(-)